MASNDTGSVFPQSILDRIAAALGKRDALREATTTIKTPSNPLKNRIVKPATFSVQVSELHEKFGLDVDQPLNYARLRRYGELLEEEMAEATQAMEQLRMAFVTKKDNHPDIIQLAANLLKELMDVHYMASALCVVFGWDEEEAFSRVHQSNLTKLWEDGKPRFHPATGKILKPQSYQEPVLEDLV
jgi:predicted HAD superfamily Cof-like phosphohydrolase